MRLGRPKGSAQGEAWFQYLSASVAVDEQGTTLVNDCD